MADIVLQFLHRVRIWFIYRTLQLSPEKFETYGIRIKSAHNTGTEGHHQVRNCSHQNHYVTSAYLNTIRRAQLCIDAGGTHFQHLLWRYILPAFGYCINFCIFAMLRNRANFSWRILYQVYKCIYVESHNAEISRSMLVGIYHLCWQVWANLPVGCSGLQFTTCNLPLLCWWAHFKILFSVCLYIYIINVYIYICIYIYTLIINLTVAPCIFVESLQFINQRMHL